eukprot:Gb_02576 [translate_table: standard]
MDWDMKTSSQWDWDNLMLFPGRGTDIGRRAQTNVWDNEAEGGNAEMDNGSLQNGSVYSPGGGSGSNFGYGSSSKSSVSVDYSAKVESDLCKIKVETKESNSVEERNVGFLDLRDQAVPKIDEPKKGKSCEMRGNGEHQGSRHGFGTQEQHQQQQRLYKGSGCRTGNDHEEGKEMNRMEKNSAALTIPVSAGSGDSLIGLKLGKRTYFEDTSGGGQIKATSVSVFPSPPSIPAKKPRASPGMQLPRCQVEGCNTDLTSSKDYHRRHKVCEIHSKSAKVMVAGIEQRFCQQCSRFHVLSEFDDGKRSCRRRLAGHNERRRKPQPDSMTLNSARLSSTFYDNRRTGILMDRSSFMHPRIVSSSMLDGRTDFKLGYGKGTWPRIVKAEDQSIFDSHTQIPGINRQAYANAVSRHNADRLLLLLQSSKAAPGDALSQGIHQYTQSPGNPLGQALTLSSVPGTGFFAGLEIASATQALSGVSDSGRALSLLSSQSWGSRAPGSASLDLATRPSVTLENFIHENQTPIAQPLMPGMQHNFGLVADKFLTISSQTSTSLVSSGFRASGVNSMDKEHQGGPLVPNIGGIGNFESHMHDLLQGQEFRGSQDASSKDARRTIDLMCRSSQAQSNESQGQPGILQHGNGQFMEFQLMKSYESSVFDSQQM